MFLGVQRMRRGDDFRKKYNQNDDIYVLRCSMVAISIGINTRHLSVGTLTARTEIAVPRLEADVGDPRRLGRLPLHPPLEHCARAVNVAEHLLWCARNPDIID